MSSKHTARCGVSAQAYDEIEVLLLDPAVAAAAYVVEVWAARPVSNAIAGRLRVRHESPQLLLVTNGRVLWSASHFCVTAQAVRTALANVPLARTGIGL